MRLLEHPATPAAPAVTTDAEALIREARRLRQRRLLIGALIVLVIGPAVVLGYQLSLTSGTPGGAHPAARPSAGAPEKGDVVPESPGALAIGPDGNLYLADRGRNEILERLPSGRFEVIAGDGRAGFSGDGGPARDAELDNPSGMAITANGVIYVADENNDRVRMMAPDGIISTVAGDGSGFGPHDEGVLNGTPALQVIAALARMDKGLPPYLL